MKKIKLLLDKKWSIYLIIFSIFFIFHLFLKTNFADDIWFKDIIGTHYENIFDYLYYRYNEWSSRLVIESILILLLQLPKIVWCILDSAIITLLSYSISELFLNKKHNKIIIIILFLMYPWHIMSSAGWYATTLNYLWPLAFGMFVFVYVKKIFTGEKLHLKDKILSLLSLIYACNQEQMCAILFGFFTIFIIYMIKNKIKDKFILIEYILIIISMIFILTCPGNDARTLIEASTWYPIWENYNFVDKIFLGISSTVSIQIFMTNALVLVLCFLVTKITLKKVTNKIIRFISIIPTFIILALNIFSSAFEGVFNGLKIAFDGIQVFTNTVQLDAISVFSKCLALFISILFVASLLISIFYIFKGNKGILLSIILLAGYASRFIIGFTPTIYASGLRTFIFLDFSIMIIVLNLLKEIDKSEYEKYGYILCGLVILSLIETTGYIR